MRRLRDGHRRGAGASAPEHGSGEAAPVRWMLDVQRRAGNAAARAALPAPAVLARREAAGGEAFVPESVVHDLRRAIDTEEVTMRPRRDALTVGLGIVGGGSAAALNSEFVRKVDAGAVVRALDGLTADQIGTVRALYSRQEGGRTLEHDLFETGASGYPSALDDDQRGRIGALLKGTASAAPGAGPPDARMEADAIELHGLLQGGLDDDERERVMALHRRPVEQIDRLDRHYALRYGRTLSVDLFDRLTGLQHARLYQLRSGDIAKADACAIEDKRRRIERIQAEERADADVGVYGGGALRDFRRQDRTRRERRLQDDIAGLLEQNRREALADPANAGRDAGEAVRERLGAVLGVRGAEEGSTLGGQLAATLGARGEAMARASEGDLAGAAAAKLMDMEARGTTSGENIAALMRDLRAAAEHDVTAKAYDPRVGDDEKRAIAADFGAAVDRRGAELIEAFIAAYDARRGAGRSYAAILESASAESKDLMTALRAGGGRMDDVTDLDLAIRKRDRDRIVQVLMRQRSRAALDALVTAYEARRGPLRQALFALGSGGGRGGFMDGLTGSVTAAIRPLLEGRRAALAGEALARPAVMNGIEEVEWLVRSGTGERDATEASSGVLGWLREIGDDPETQDLMNESARQLVALRAEWIAGDPWGRPRQDILAEMRRVRSTLTGDAIAYEEENARMRDQIRAAVSFAVQVALAMVLPGGGGLIASIAMNVGASVAANMVIYGEDYTLERFQADVLGGVTGGVGARLGRQIATTVASRAARPAAEAARRLGLTTALAREAATAGALAGEAGIALRIAGEGGELLGGAGANTLVTGQNGFTLQDMGTDLLLNLVGGLRGGGHGGGHGDGRPHPEGAGHPDGAGPAVPHPGDVPAGAVPHPGGGGTPDAPGAGHATGDVPGRPERTPAGARDAPGPAHSRVRPDGDAAAALEGNPGAGLRGHESTTRVAEAAVRLGAPTTTSVNVYAQGLHAQMAAELRALGVAAPRVEIVDLGAPDRWGHFDHTANVIRVNPHATVDGRPGSPLQFDISTPRGRERLLSTLFHESRHAEQMFHALRHMARTDPTLARARREGIDPAIIEAALARPLPTGRSADAEMAERSFREYFGERRSDYDTGQDADANDRLRDGIRRLEERRQLLDALISLDGGDPAGDPGTSAWHHERARVVEGIRTVTADLAGRERIYWDLYVEIDARGAEAELMVQFRREMASAEQRRLETRLRETAAQLDVALEHAPDQAREALRLASEAAREYREHLRMMREALGMNTSDFENPGGGS